MLKRFIIRLCLCYNEPQMSIRNQRGFTIIELLLFLAVSAALFVALMVGVNSNIVQQQYRDSVAAYSGVLQQQYSEVENTKNEKREDRQYKCANSDVEEVTIGSQPRGASECVIMGRFVRVVDNGTKIETGSIIGSKPASEAGLLSDTLTVLAYKPKLSTVAADLVKQDITWGSKLTVPSTDSTASTMSFVIIRSPLSGLIRVYTSVDAIPSTLTNMITEDASKLKTKVCVEAADLLAGPRYSVEINPTIAGPNGIVTRSGDEQC